MGMETDTNPDDEFWRTAPVERIVVSPEAFVELVEMVEAESVDSPALRDLMSRPAPWSRQERLQRASTRDLLAMRDSCYRIHGGTLTPEQIEDGYGYDPDGHGTNEIPLSEILAELNTREHVPNKSERAEIRRAKQKEKQNR